MIINFSVQNFGSIKEKQTLSFLANKSDHLEDYYIIEPIKGLRLNKLALIYGANASGKTTVLKALDFLRNICTEPFDKKNEKFDFEPFLFDENTPKENTKFELDFLQNGVRYYYEVEVNQNCVVKEKLFNYNPNKAVVFERTTNEKKELTSIIFGNKIEKRKNLKESLELHTLWNNSVFGGFMKSNVDSQELSSAHYWFDEVLANFFSTKADAKDFFTEQLDLKRLNKRVILSILKKADINIFDIEISKREDSKLIELLESSIKKTKDQDKIKHYKNLLNSDFTINRNLHFFHNVNNNLYKLNLGQESDGTQRYFEYSGLLSLLLSKQSIFLIDELEFSLHPDLFQHFLLTFLVNSKKSQIIATTHNREILNNRDIFRDDAIWFTDKNEDSATELYSLADFDSSVVRDTSNVLNAYKSGKLGGVPNLGDYYIDLEDGEK